MSGKGPGLVIGTRPPASAATKAPMSAAELAEKKRLVQERLKEKEKRVSRLSMVMNGSRTSTRAQQHVDQMADKLKKMQALLKKNEETRAQEEAFEAKRAEDEKRLQRLTSELEKAVDPNAMTKSQKDRRTKNMMSLLRQVGGKITEEALETLEKGEREMDDKERRERKEKMEVTEKRLKEINMKMRDHARTREEASVARLQKQLESMEGKLKSIEGGMDGDSFQDEEDDEKEMKDWENHMKQLRVEREQTMKKRKEEMDKRLRELQEMVDEKRRKREEALMMRDKRREAALRQELASMDEPLPEDDYESPRPAAKTNGNGSGGGAPRAAANMPSGSDLEAWMQKIVEERLKKLDDSLKKKAEAEDEAMERRAKELREKEALMKQREEAHEAQMKQLAALSQFSDISQLAEKFAQLAKVQDVLDALGKKVDNIKYTGGGGGGGGDATMTAEEIMKEIQEAQRIIFDENSTEKQIAEANINLEKLMVEYEKTPECRAAKEEKRLANDKLNKAALEVVRANLKTLTPDQMKERLTNNPEMKLLLMEPPAILKLHQNDFKMFAIRGLTQEELRALRGCLPTFRRDQTVQSGWVESIEAKIEELAANKAPPPKPVAPKKAGGPKKWKAPAAGAAGKGGDIFSEILARKKASGGDDDDAPAAPSAASLQPNVAIAKNAPPPPMMKGGKMPPLPPPGPDKNMAAHVPITPPPNAPKPPPPPPPGGLSNSASSPPPPPPGAKGPPPPPPSAPKAGGESFMGSSASRPIPAANAPTEDEVKNEVDALVNMVFTGASESDVVTKCKVLSEQIKVLAGDHKELAPKARFLIMAVKEGMVARNGTAAEAAHAKQKLVVVVNSFKRALQEDK